MKKIIYKNKFLFKLLRAYWIILYLFEVIKKKNNFYELSKSQHENEENEFLESLIPHVENKSFAEIGFHFKQFNSINLIKNNLKGNLIDTSKYDYLNILISRFIMRLLKKDINVVDAFVSLKNINDIIEKKPLGFLSIDIDGNDYWILLEILKNKTLPEVVIVEYNASLLRKPITIPYIENFNLNTYHSSKCYHGASLTAFDKLLSKYNYSLIKSIAGVNAIFINDSIFKKLDLPKLDPNTINQECLSRNKRLKNTSKEQYDLIKHLSFVEV